FGISVLDAAGSPTSNASVVAGREDPPRGWLSRHYGDKVAVPSFAVTQEGPLPMTFVSLACPGVPEVQVEGETWTIATAGGTARFRTYGAGFTEIEAVADRVTEPAF